VQFETARLWENQRLPRQAQAIDDTCLAITCAVQAELEQLLVLQKRQQKSANPGHKNNAEALRQISRRQWAASAAA